MTEERDGDREPRRRLLKKLAAGGSVASLAALPGKWAKPVVASVILPAHAQTSPGCVGTLDNCPSGSLFSTSGSFNTNKYFSTSVADLIPGVTATGGTLSGSGSTVKYSNFGPCPAPCDDAVASKYVTISGSFGDGSAIFGVDGEYRCGAAPVYTIDLNFAGTNISTVGATYTGNFSYDVESCKYFYGDSTLERSRSRQGLRNFRFGN